MSCFTFIEEASRLLLTEEKNGRACSGSWIIQHARPMQVPPPHITFHWLPELYSLSLAIFKITCRPTSQHLFRLLYYLANTITV